MRAATMAAQRTHSAMPHRQHAPGWRELVEHTGRHGLIAGDDQQNRQARQEGGLMRLASRARGIGRFSMAWWWTWCAEGG
jgi:hypothetical protein